METIVEQCQALTSILHQMKVNVTVEYGEVPELGNWFYVRRTLYDGYYRLGHNFSSAKRYVEIFFYRKEYLPSDLVRGEE